MNDVDPQAWLADVLARIAERPVQRLDELLPWNWCRQASAARLESVFCSRSLGKRRTAEDAKGCALAFIHAVNVVINQYSVL
jgi:IS66 C-terminal element